MKLRDTQDEILEQLKLLNRNLARRFGDQQTQTAADTPGYFTTGPNGLTLDDTNEFEEMQFGFIAQTVNLRFSDNVEVAFANPNRNSGKAIPFVAEESPVTLGGFAGVDAPKLWIRKAQTASNDVEAHVIAFE